MYWIDKHGSWNFTVDSRITGSCSVARRPRNFPADAIFWLSHSSRNIEGELEQDPALGHLLTAFDALHQTSDLRSNVKYRRTLRRIAPLLKEKQVYLVIDGRGLTSKFSRQNLEVLVHDMLNISARMLKILLILPDISEPVLRENEDKIKVESLDAKATAMVFAKHVPLELRQEFPKETEWDKIFDLLNSHPSDSHKYQELWRRFGEGIPGKIISKAKGMSKDDFLKIVDPKMQT